MIKYCQAQHTFQLSKTLILDTIIRCCSVSFETCLLGENHLDKVFIVDVSLGVLLSVDELLHLLLAHLLPQAGEEMTKFRCRDPPISVLIKMSKPLDKILDSVSDLFTGHCLHHRQKHVEREARVRLGLTCRLDQSFDLTLGRILSEGSKNVPHLRNLNHVVSPGVEEQEGILELRHLVLGEGRFLRHLRAWMETGEPGTGTQRREVRRPTEVETVEYWSCREDSRDRPCTGQRWSGSAETGKRGEVGGLCNIRQGQKV